MRVCLRAGVARPSSPHQNRTKHVVVSLRERKKNTPTRSAAMFFCWRGGSPMFRARTHNQTTQKNPRKRESRSQHQINTCQCACSQDESGDFSRSRSPAPAPSFPSSSQTKKKITKYLFSLNVILNRRKAHASLVRYTHFNGVTVNGVWD